MHMNMYDMNRTKNIIIIRKRHTEAPPLTPPLNLTSLARKQIVLKCTNKIKPSEIVMNYHDIVLAY